MALLVNKDELVAGLKGTAATLSAARELRESMRDPSKQASTLCKQVVEKIMQSKGVGDFAPECTRASAMVAECGFNEAERSAGPRRVFTSSPRHYTHLTLRSPRSLHPLLL